MNSFFFRGGIFGFFFMASETLPIYLPFKKWHADVKYHAEGELINWRGWESLGYCGNKVRIVSGFLDLKFPFWDRSEIKERIVESNLSKFTT